jgi:very-short-patch-repair endonuclease
VPETRPGTLSRRFAHHRILAMPPAAYLVVEVDGRHHEHRRGKDRQRDRYLWASHHRVMRVENRLYAIESRTSGGRHRRRAIGIT